MKYSASLLAKPVVTCYPEETVFDAAVKMHDHKIGSIVVISETDLPIGILSERDIVNRLVATGKDAKKTNVSAVMTPEPVTLESSEPLEVVFEYIGKKFRHLPITEEGRLIGIVSLTDVAKVLPKIFKDEKLIKEFALAVGRGTDAYP